MQFVSCDRGPFLAWQNAARLIPQILRSLFVFGYFHVEYRTVHSIPQILPSMFVFGYFHVEYRTVHSIPQILQLPFVFG